jgi:hypothetical protein
MKGFRAFGWSTAEIVNNLKTRLTRQLDRTEVWYVRI